MFHLLKNPVGNQYIEALRILVPPEILVPAEISAQFERYYLSSTEFFSRSRNQKDFDIYDPLTICNFPKILAKNKYLCVGC